MTVSTQDACAVETTALRNDLRQRVPVVEQATHGAAPAER